MSAPPAPACPLCQTDGGELVWRGDKLRVIRAAEPLYPAWYRVIWNGHVKEFSQLSREDRLLCMDAVHAVELALIEHLKPTKVNLAQFGNMVPHLHWHIIARFEGDAHFPNPTWGEPLQAGDDAVMQAARAHLTEVNASITQRCLATTKPQ
jgi:diadenosine tetraphosphate (Ap4A) HIT family hydrolase